MVRWGRVPDVLSRSHDHRRLGKSMVNTILGRKLGMTQVWDENDNVVPVTVVLAGPAPFHR